jgi:hypothetical protein
LKRNLTLEIGFSTSIKLEHLTKFLHRTMLLPNANAKKKGPRERKSKHVIIMETKKTTLAIKHWNKQSEKNNFIIKRSW